MLYFYSINKNDFFANEIFTITNATYAPYGPFWSSGI